jgi:transposase-like protein
MKLHANAKLGPKGRLVICQRVTEQGWSLTEAAEAAGVSERTPYKWVCRFRAEGEAGLADRSSEPRSIPRRTCEDRVAAIAALRRLRMTGPEVAECLGMALSTVSACCGELAWASSLAWSHSSRPTAMSASEPAS